MQSETIASATVAGVDQFTTPRRFAGPFTLLLPAAPGGANVCRLQCSADGTTYINATDKDGVAYSFTAQASIVVDNVSGQMWWRAGSPAADYSSGSYTVYLVP